MLAHHMLLGGGKTDTTLHAVGISAPTSQILTLRGKGEGKWKSSSLPAEGTFTSGGVAYGSGKFVAALKNIVCTSEDAINWSARELIPSSNSIKEVIYAANKFILITSNCEVYTSTEGDNWILSSTCSLSSSECIRYGNNLFLAASFAGHFAISKDLVIWKNTPYIRGTRQIYNNNITFGEGFFVVAGHTCIHRTQDGETWENVFEETSRHFKGVTYGKGLFVACGYVGYAAVSDDRGASWNLIQIEDATMGFLDVSYIPHLDKFIITDNNNTLWCSSNGVDWERCYQYGSGKPRQNITSLRAVL